MHDKTLERLIGDAAMLLDPLPDSINKLRFDLTFWGIHEGKDHDPLDNNACGTTACAWGTIAVRHALKKTPQAPRLFWYSIDDQEAKRLAILSPSISDTLARNVDPRELRDLTNRAAEDWYGLTEEWTDRFFLPDLYAASDVTVEMVAERMMWAFEALQKYPNDENEALKAFRHHVYDQNRFDR
jgi:hypothetical protein